MKVAAYNEVALIAKFLVNQFTWSCSGPISMVMTLAILTWYLRSRGHSWSDMGLRTLPGTGENLSVYQWS